MFEPRLIPVWIGIIFLSGMFLLGQDSWLPQSECTVAADCDDLNPCTDDECVDGTCVYAFNTVTCDDGSVETQNDQCLCGSCIGIPIGSPCPIGMVLIEGFCIDKWEAHISGQSPYEVPTGGKPALACGAVIPQGYISGTEAENACELAGKRLCTVSEWLRACQGPDGWTYPYGETYIAQSCNDVRDVHPVIELFGPDPDWTYEQLNDPRLNQFPDTLDETGANPECVSSEGVYDLVGNLNEWVADPSGTWKGGSYVESFLNGDGCLYTTTAHDIGYHDFLTGFRCCKDP